MLTVAEFRNLSECQANFSPALKGLWYSRCGKSEVKGNLSDEWEHIARNLLQ